LSSPLYDAASGGTRHGLPVGATAVGVTNGLFTVTLDFGNQFSGSALWLDISVRTNGAGELHGVIAAATNHARALCHQRRRTWTGRCRASH